MSSLRRRADIGVKAMASSRSLLTSRPAGSGLQVSASRSTDRVLTSRPVFRRVRHAENRARAGIGGPGALCAERRTRSSAQPLTLNQSTFPGVDAVGEQLHL